MNFVLLLIPVIPLIAAIFIFLLKKEAHIIPGAAATISFSVSLILTIFLFDQSLQINSTLFELGDLRIDIGLSLDGLSWFMSAIISIVGALVSLYSIGYMEGCKRNYFGVSAFFISAMLTLVLSSNFFLMFAAWESVGLSSFLLIGFWYSREDAKQAARKAFLMTRIGDAGFLLAMLFILVSIGNLNIEYFLGADLSNTDINLIAFLFFIAALGKSAQLPFSAWLSDAMAGPTPVSALIHSATMVAAGVYLIARIFPVFELSNIAMSLAFYIGAATAITAALIAATRIDFKRILAWSTISQLGEMFFVLGLGGALAALFHLAAHAVFKSTLFLTAGVVSHSTGTRRIDELGGLLKKMPLVFSIFVIGAFSLSGFPPFAGFWSEEEILADAFGKGIAPGLFMMLLIFTAGIYISRAGYAVFGNWKGMKNPDAEKNPQSMIAPMIILAAAAIIIGYVLKVFLPEVLVFEKKYHLSWTWRILAILASGAGLFSGAFAVYKRGPKPIFNSAGKYLKSLIDNSVTAFVFLGKKLSSAVFYLEEKFDSAAQASASAVLKFATAVNISENIFNNFAKGTGAFAFSSARFTDDAELYGFEQGTRDLTDAFSKSSSKLKSFQNGKVFVYLLGLVIWFLILSVVSIIILIN